MEKKGKSIQETMTNLGYGHMYKTYPPRPQPTYCEFCCDAPEDELSAHGGCACCGNNGYYDRKCNKSDSGSK